MKKQLHISLHAGMKILIIKPSSLGDIAQSVPVASSLKSFELDISIHWLVNDSYADLLTLCPAVDQVIIFRRNLWKWGTLIQAGKNLLEIVKICRQQRYDLVIDLQGLLRSGLFALQTSAPVRIGFAHAREGAAICYNYTISVTKDIHAFTRYMKVAGLFGTAALDKQTFISLSEKSISYVRDVLSGGKKRIVVAPEARWSSKEWGRENYRSLIMQLLATYNDIKIVIIGTRIGTYYDSINDSRVVNMIGKTDLAQMIALISDSNLVICNDSGPMHIACLSKRKTIALFGPTQQHLTGPWLGEYKVIAVPGISCNGCRKRDCEDPLCMLQISVKEVLQTVVSVLD